MTENCEKVLLPWRYTLKRCSSDKDFLIYLCIMRVLHFLLRNLSFCRFEKLSSIMICWVDWSSSILLSCRGYYWLIVTLAYPAGVQLFYLYIIWVGKRIWHFQNMHLGEAFFKPWKCFIWWVGRVGRVGRMARVGRVGR